MMNPPCDMTPPTKKFTSLGTTVSTPAQRESTASTWRPATEQSSLSPATALAPTALWSLREPSSSVTPTETSLNSDMLLMPLELTSQSPLPARRPRIPSPDPSACPRPDRLRRQPEGQLRRVRPAVIRVKQSPTLTIHFFKGEFERERTNGC